MKYKALTFSLAATVIVLTAGLWWLSTSPRTAYSCAQVQYEDITTTLTVSGTITHSKEIAITPRITGSVSTINVKSGQKVSKGQVLMTLQAIPDLSKLEIAEESVDLEEIALKQADADFVRAQQLYEGKAISEKEYEAARNSLAIAKNRYTSAVNQRRIITDGNSGRKTSDNASIVFSPIDGEVTEIFVDEGETVAAMGFTGTGTMLCRIGDDGPLVFKGNVDETDIASLKEGDRATLVLGAFPDKTIPAIITSISTFGQTQKGFTLFEIEADLGSVPKGVNLRCGFSANAHIRTGCHKHVLSLGEECIKFDEFSSAYVLKLVSPVENVRHQKWEKVYVTLGESDGSKIQIISGLEEGDYVQSNTSTIL